MPACIGNHAEDARSTVGHLICALCHCIQGNDNDMLEGVMEVEVVNEPSIKKGEGGWNRGCYKGGPSKFPVKGGGRENKTIVDGGSIL